MKTNPLALIALALPFEMPGIAQAEQESAFGALAEKVKSIQTKAIPTKTTSPLHQANRALQTSNCGTNCCTPCAKGLTPTLPDGTIDLGGFAPELVTAMTCSEGMELVKTFAADSASCSTLQMVGFSFCGCPEPPVLPGVEKVCTLCSDRMPVPEPDVLFDLGNSESISCGLAQLGLGFLDSTFDASSSDVASKALSTMEQTTEVAASDDTSYDTDMNIDECSLMQNSVGTMCGCAKASSITNGGCMICSDYGTLINPNHVVDVQEGLTCGAGAQQASIIPADDAFCAHIQGEAIVAGCKCNDTNNVSENELPDANTSSSGVENSEMVAVSEAESNTSSSAFISTASPPIMAITIALALL